MRIEPVAHRAHWGLTRGGLDRQSRWEHATCSCCGLPIHGWRATVPGSKHADDGTTQCPLCALSSSLDRPSIDREAELIWLPELSQRALIPLVRGAHVTLFKAGVMPGSTQAAPHLLTDGGRDAVTTLRGLRERAGEARARLGTSSPRILGAAILEATAKGGEPLSFGAIRVLPLGHWFENGQDIYPTILSDWSKPSTGS
jgi:hypothetical protein